MEKKNIKEYLQEMLDRWNKYDELDGFVAENFRTDLEKTLEYWNLRIEEPVYVANLGETVIGSSKELTQEKLYKEFLKYKKSYIENIWKSGVPDDLIEDTLNNVDEFLKSKLTTK
mgnify:CR=1 FL=1